MTLEEQTSHNQTPAGGGRVLWAALLLSGGCETHVAEFGCEGVQNGVVEGNVLIASPEDAETCEGVREITGTLRVSGLSRIVDGVESHEGNDRLRNLEGLGALRRVRGVVIEYNEALQSLDGLGALRVGDDAMYIRNNAELHDVAALAQVTPSGLTIHSNDSLASVTGVEQLLALDYGMVISAVPVRELASLSLEQAGALRLIDLPLLERCPTFSNAPVLGTLALTRLPNVHSLQPLTSVRQVDLLALNGLGVTSLSELRDWDPNLQRLALVELDITSLAGFEQLTTLDELTLAKLPHLQSLQDLENLREIHGTLYINRLDALEALDFPVLERIDGDVEITENPRLSKAAIDDFLARVEITGEVRDCLNATQKPCF